MEPGGPLSDLVPGVGLDGCSFALGAALAWESSCLVPLSGIWGPGLALDGVPPSI